MNAQPGSYLRKTVDCFTRPGAVQLVNEDKEQLMADYLRCVCIDEAFVCFSLLAAFDCLARRWTEAMGWTRICLCEIIFQGSVMFFCELRSTRR